RVVLDGDKVIRLLDERGVEGWRALSGTDLFRKAVADGRLIESVEVDPPDGSAGALIHPRLDLITYPYEWTFSMLRDAALLQLDLLEEALSAGLTIKDATPYNIQFVDGRPRFIDVGSFETYRKGEPWIGYRQFTRQFLFPLLLRAWVGVPFQPWLRGDLEGLTPAQMSKLLGGRKRFNISALLHVRAQARMESRMADRAVRKELSEAGFNADLILANVRKLRSLVDSLSWEDGEQGWSTYVECSHVTRDRTAKSEFLDRALKRFSPRRVMDLGANDGHFSRIAAQSGAIAIAIDSYEPVLDEVYRRNAGTGVAVALTDLANPSPSQGWAGQERASLMERARPDLVIAYGVIHHLIYGASIPPREVVRWLSTFRCPVVLEFVSPADEMVSKLVGNKLPHELHPGGEESEFRAILDNWFVTVDEQVLSSATRVLFALEPR
ncbi:MAG TPA: methyltransferase domain-containing protein, partial [Acidimicrobiia bacterium]|nr:methyltransferase domain-containing protein [Acidimicrobiia bacterium]